MSRHRHSSFAVIAALLLATAMPSKPSLAAPADASKPASAGQAQACPTLFTPETHESEGTVTIGKRRIAYRAVAGTLVVHAKGWQDGVPCPPAGGKEGAKGPKPEAAMSYV
ncbi:MAG: hypothetical protein D6757_08175, partial [Alphaproteobacteria bacterium]